MKEDPERWILSELTKDRNDSNCYWFYSTLFQTPTHRYRLTNACHPVLLDMRMWLWVRSNSCSCWTDVQQRRKMVSKWQWVSEVVMRAMGMRDRTFSKDPSEVSIGAMMKREILPGRRDDKHWSPESALTIVYLEPSTKSVQVEQSD